MIENKLYVHLKNNVKKNIKTNKDKRKEKYKESEGQEKDEADSGYPPPNNTEPTVVVNEEKLTYQNCCCGFSTEMDQLSKSKKNALAIEGKWTQIVQQRQGISMTNLQNLISKSMVDHVKQYETIYQLLH